MANNLPMDGSVWVRVLEEAGRHAKGREQQWLVEQLTSVKASDEPDYTIQRVHNWATRGVPKREYPALALALGKSIDWVAGHEPRERKAAAPQQRPSGSDAELLAAFNSLPRDEREKLRAQITERADVFRAYLEEVNERQRPEPAVPETATGLPAPFVERRSIPPAPSPHVVRRRGIAVHINPRFAGDDPNKPVPGEWPLRRHDDVPAPPQKPKPRKPSK